MHQELLQTIEKYLELDKFYNIAFIGDSLTSCEWIHPNWREIVEYVLKQELEEKMEDWKLPAWKLRTFNVGFNGGNSSDVLHLLQESVLIHKPALAFIMLGTNDADFQTATPEEFKENIKLMCKRLSEIGCKDIVLMTSPKTLDKDANDGYVNYFKLLEELTLEENLYFLDLYRKFENLKLEKIYTFISPRDEMDGTKAGDIDQVHPNRLGNAYIAKFVLEELFRINFNPKLYLETLLQEEKFPRYNI
jgi:lysophospholipase L1-like esterase